MTRKEQAAITKRKIVSVLEEQLQHQKLSDIKIKDICSQANIAAGTFYVHFSCKEEAFLYIYRDKDEDFTNLILTEDPVQNLRIILDAYFGMVDSEHPQFNRELYISHLKYYDDYFFSEDRSIFKMLNHELARMGCNDHNIVWKILRFCRGAIYNYCISFSSDAKQWKEQTLMDTMEYISFLIRKN